LKQCKKPSDPDNPRPFASCFVCDGTGHLASSCPQNAGKGVYPNGGCCKLCRETSHLAKDCPLRNQNPDVGKAGFVGIGADAGADEDDFHTIGRTKVQLNDDERAEARVKRKAQEKVGVVSGAPVRASTASKNMARVVTF
jgi:zinc finger CCHC domain-containing protein 9